MLEQLKKAKGKGKTIQKSSGQEEKEEEKVGTRIRLGLKPWGELIIVILPNAIWMSELTNTIYHYFPTI